MSSLRLHAAKTAGLDGPGLVSGKGAFAPPLGGDSFAAALGLLTGGSADGDAATGDGQGAASGKPGDDAAACVPGTIGGKTVGVTVDSPPVEAATGGSDADALDTEITNSPESASDASLFPMVTTDSFALTDLAGPVTTRVAPEDLVSSDGTKRPVTRVEHRGAMNASQGSDAMPAAVLATASAAAPLSVAVSPGERDQPTLSDDKSASSAPPPGEVFSRVFGPPLSIAEQTDRQVQNAAAAKAGVVPSGDAPPVVQGAITYEPARTVEAVGSALSITRPVGDRAGNVGKAGTTSNIGNTGNSGSAGNTGNTRITGSVGNTGYLGRSSQQTVVAAATAGPSAVTLDPTDGATAWPADPNLTITSRATPDPGSNPLPGFPEAVARAFSAATGIDVSGNRGSSASFERPAVRPDEVLVAGTTATSPPLGPATLGQAGVPAAGGGADVATLDALPRHLSDQLVQMASGAARDVVLQLHPPELGSVTVRVMMSGHDVSAWFTAPQSDVQQAITQSIGQLQTDLGSAGYNLSGAWVGGDAVGARGQGGNSQGDNSQGGHSPRGSGARVAVDLAALTTTAASGREATSSRVSIYV